MFRLRKISKCFKLRKLFFGIKIPMINWGGLLYEKYVKSLKEGIVLDLGCGTEVNRELSRRHKLVVGIDLVYEVLTKAKSTKEDNVELVQADAHSPPFRKYSFNLIIISHVLEHLMEPEECLKNVYNLLKPNGRVFIAIPFLAELLSPSFSKNPLHQWAKVLLTRALDNIRLGKKSLLVKIFFKSTKPIKLRRFIPRKYHAKIWYKQEIDLEWYCNAFIRNELKDPHHKHFFTRKEWLNVVKKAGLRILECRGLYNVYIVAER